jgi:hypothetical protein
MSIWFEGSQEIATNLATIKQALENLGSYFVGIVKLMPGLALVELVEEGPDFVHIKTSEGLMKRFNISKQIEAEKIVLAYEEEYQAGRLLTTKAHFLDEFAPQKNGAVTYRLIIRDLEAPGVAGFFYRNLGPTNIGKAFLQAQKTYFEQKPKKEA